MKKAKVMLSAIAVFAIVGGAVAFKAHKATKFIYLQSAGKCTSLLTSVIPTTTTAASYLTYGFTSTTIACPSAGYFTSAGLND